MGKKSADYLKPTELDRKEFLRELFSSDYPIVYMSDEYPGEIIREYPDGSRCIIRMDENGKKSFVRNIEPVRHST